jgi:hypothetical protein
MPEGSSLRRVRAIESEGLAALVGGAYDDAVAEAVRAAEKGGL